MLKMGYRFLLFYFVMNLYLGYSVFSQCPAGLELSTTNLVVNGDFSLGNTSFTSDHNYCSTPGCLATEGAFTVAADPSIYQPSFEGADHTSGSGNFLMVNGSTSAGSAAWCQTIPTEANSFYEISFWVSSLVPQNPASIQLYINTFPFFSPAGAPGSTNSWLPFKQTWVSGITTSATVCLVNTNTAANGNDFGLDDISIKKCECALQIDAGPGGAICKGDSIQLTGSLSPTYYWTPTSGLSCFICEDPKASPQQTTVYTANAQGPGGCTATDTVTVTVFPQLDLHAGPDTTICPGQSVMLHADGAVDYLWSPSTGLSDPSIPNPVSTPASPVTYFLSALDEHGCDQSDSMHIDLFPSPGPVVAGFDTTVCRGTSVTIQVTADGAITWTPSDHLSCDNCIQPIVFTDTTITYVVSVTDPNGCFAGTDSVTVTIDTTCDESLPPTMMIPSAFSPNNDGKNDHFNVVGSGIQDYRLDIYNRWGELVFTTNNTAFGWDGTYNSQQQNVGVYTWHLTGSLVTGVKIEKSGNVTLIR